jgi:TonB family protein
MSTIRLVSLIPFAAVLALAPGCSSAEPATANAAEAAKGQPEGYGYDFEADPFGPRGGAAPGPVAAPASGVRMPPETVQSVVRAGAGPLAACYQTALATQPGLTGEIALKFTVDASGAPAGTRVEKSTLPGGTIDACVLAAFGALRFPPSNAGVMTVLYPIRFAP